MDDLHRNYKTRSMFEGAWKGLEHEATPSLQSSSLSPIPIFLSIAPIIVIFVMWTKQTNIKLMYIPY